MKNKVNFIMLVLVLTILVNVSYVNAISQAEIIPGDVSLAYGVQVLDGQIRALNLEGELGISANFGIEGIYTYADKQPNSKNNKLDINAKFNITKHANYDVTALVGYHIGFDQNNPRIGVIYSKKENKYLDLNIGLDFLLERNEHYIGYLLGLDYMLTNNIYIEMGHRKFSGQKNTEGLNLGVRYYF